MSKVISLEHYRVFRRVDSAALQDEAYLRVLQRMEKAELLEEMVRFQQRRSKVDSLTLPMMIRGRILFSTIEKTADTEALKSLASSYRRHLEHELELEVKKHSGS